MSVHTPATVEDVIAAARANGRVIPHGARTKQPLIAADEPAARVDLSALSGVTEYDAAEYTFSALAGTTLRELATLLAANAQCMPFDPPLVEEGATIGGTVAAGLSGPGRLRYGGVRDFLIGARFVDGTGRLIRGGGRVVKNAAGFDLPRLLVGSMGRLGILVEVTFKVFPAPEARCTLRITCRDADDAVDCMAGLTRRPLELDALELEPPHALLVLVTGDAASLDALVTRVGAAAARPFDRLEEHEAERQWRRLRSFAWVEDTHWLIKVPITLRRLSTLERALDRQAVTRRYGVAGNVAWLSWPSTRPLGHLDLAGNAGLVVRGPRLASASPFLGPPALAAEPFAQRVKHALDPDARLPACT